ncbi:MAG: mandelate racemase/muconate lactonizing enzyme family protein [Chloroflexi bacterium]|nr:mandelate racemase/muconate lactonizing enzyme family protein [Chloroflexota bacterium]MCI0858354.1 mandelate racemase/muconate lactonizing enzyme family protein [Chloroflexota bacterium]
MKVTRATTRILSTPADNPLVVGVPVGDATREFVTLELDTDEGIQGIGLTFFGGPLTRALKEAVDALCGMVIGQDPMPVESIMSGLRQAASGAGPGGIFTLALSAVDIALWDIKGQALGQTVCSLLGGYRDRAPTYASGALIRPMNLEYLAEAGPRLVEMGFKQMKTQMGAESTPAREVERMRVMREGIGPDIDLMCDINQLWNVNQAIDIGKRVEEFNLFWLEDVVAHDDYQGLARVADALTTPICAGEYQYGIRPFRHMLEHRSIDIVMIDLLRVGGITQWKKLAGMAEAFNLPVVSHLIPEIHVHLVSAIPNGLTVEYMPWTLRLFEETPVMEDGELAVPDKPGLGLKFDQDVLKRYQVS